MNKIRLIRDDRNSIRLIGVTGVETGADVGGGSILLDKEGFLLINDGIDVACVDIPNWLCKILYKEFEKRVK